MSARNGMAFAAAGALLAIFSLGAHRIWTWQADAGDGFPPYSSLRSDPLGLRVLYETIGELPGYSVTRLYEPPSEHRPEGPGTLLFVGVQRPMIHELPSAPLAAFARRGGTIVVAWSPDAEPPPPTTNRAGTSARPPRTASPDVLHIWGAELRREPSRVPLRASDGWPWYSPLYFECSRPEEWDVWLECEGRPVLISRPWQGGRIVLATDSYLFSNEGMLRHRRDQLLCRMIAKPAVWFSEAHLGLRHVPGWRDYAVRLRLHAVGLVALSLLVLSLWRVSAPLLPPRSAAAPRAVRDPSAWGDGFLDLIRRHVPPERLPELFYREWRRTCALSNPAAAARLAAAGSPPPDRPPLEAIRELYARIHRKE